MRPRLALQIVDAHDRSVVQMLPDDVSARTLRVGFRGDVELPLPGELLIAEREGRVYVASVRHEVPAVFGGCRLPAWLVPVPVPGTLTIGACEVRFFWAAPPRIVRGHHETTRRRRSPPAPQGPYLADRVLVSCVAAASRAGRAIRSEWRAARVETKLAFAAVLLATVVAAR